MPRVAHLYHPDEGRVEVPLGYVDASIRADLLPAGPGRVWLPRPWCNRTDLTRDGRAPFVTDPAAATCKACLRALDEDMDENAPTKEEGWRLNRAKGLAAGRASMDLRARHWQEWEVFHHRHYAREVAATLGEERAVAWLTDRGERAVARLIETGAHVPRETDNPSG